MTSIVKKPEWSEKVGEYNFNWDGLNVNVRINRLQEKDKIISGEVRLSRSAKDGLQIIDETRLNLLSERDRASFAERLFKRNKDIDWLSILKYACLITIAHFRQGEPLGILGGKPESLEAVYLLYPLLRWKEPTTIFADGGTGKSYLADYVAVLVHYATCGFYIRFIDCPLSPNMPVNVLLLDWESSLEVHQKRVWAIKQALGIENNEEFIYYQRCNQPLCDMLPEIKRIITEKQIGLTIIDSQVAASMGDSDKADGAREFYKGLRYLDCTSLTLDHVSKGSDLNETKKPYGSTFKWNLSRSQFELKKYQTPGENVIQLALYHRKSNEGMLMSPFGYQMEFVNNEHNELEKVIFTGIDIPDELSTGETNNLTKRIKMIITNSLNGRATSKNISTVLKISEKAVLTVLIGHKELFSQFNEYWQVNAQEYEENENGN